MSESTGKNNAEKGKNPAMKKPVMGTPPSMFALGLVALAVLVGLLLVTIVNSDDSATANKNDSKSNAANSSNTASDNNSTKETAATTTTTTPISGTKNPSEVTVLVLNGSSKAGVATSVTAEVEKLEYKTLEAGNDSSIDNNTIIYYKSGFEKDAKQLATNIIPGALSSAGISQDISTKQFPSNAPISWDQQNLVAANIVIIIGDA